MDKIQIMITDDNDEIRASLRAYLDSQQDMAVIGEGSHGGGALRIPNEKKADLLPLGIITPPPVT